MKAGATIRYKIADGSYAQGVAGGTQHDSAGNLTKVYANDTWIPANEAEEVAQPEPSPIPALEPKAAPKAKKGKGE